MKKMSFNEIKELIERDDVNDGIQAFCKNGIISNKYIVYGERWPDCILYFCKKTNTVFKSVSPLFDSCTGGMNELLKEFQEYVNNFFNCSIKISKTGHVALLVEQILLRKTSQLEFDFS